MRHCWLAVRLQMKMFLVWFYGFLEFDCDEAQLEVSERQWNILWLVFRVALLKFSGYLVISLFIVFLIIWRFGAEISWGGKIEILIKS